VRQLANTLTFKVHDAIVPLPGSTPVRRMIVDEALEYLQRLDAESAGDPALQLELARAYARIGDVQGNNSGAHFGEPDNAMKSYERALALLEPSRASSFEAAIAYGDISLSLADVRMAQDGADDSIARRRAVLDHADALLARFPGNDEAERLVARANAACGRVLEPSKAFPYFERAVSRYRVQLERKPDDLTRLRDLASVERLLGENHRLAGNPAKGLEHYRRARELAERQLALQPGSTLAADQLATTLVDLGLLSLTMVPPDSREAVAMLERALLMRREMAEADPRNVRAQRAVGWTLGALAQAEAESGRAGAARSHLDEAMSRDAAFPMPSAIGFHVQLAGAWQALGRAYARQGQSRGVCLAYRQSVHVLTGLEQAIGPDHANRPWYRVQRDEATRALAACDD
jgi:tetratricopeptide (TPR) repeat protein